VLQLFAVVLAIALFSQLLTCEVALDANEGLLITTAFYALILLVVYMLLRQGGEGFSNLGMRISGLGTFILLAAVLGIIAQFIWAILLAAASGNLVFNFGALPAETFLPQVLVMALLVGFVEESAFRGYIQRKFTASYGFVRALILASFLFMIIHIQFYTYYKLTDPAVQAALGVTAADVSVAIQFLVTQTVIAISALGIFAGFIYRKSGQNVLSSAAFHITFNVGGLLMGYSNASVIAFSLGYGTFAFLWMLWAILVGALLWVATKAIFPKSR